jgi:hypothetical protein
MYHRWLTDGYGALVGGIMIGRRKQNAHQLPLESNLTLNNKLISDQSHPSAVRSRQFSTVPG